MRKFIIEILIYALCVAAMFGAYLMYLQRKAADADFYLHAYNDKLALLDSTQGTQRIVLVGGSNLAFGVDSEMLGDSLGHRVVNAALHGGLGLKTPMHDIGKYLQKDDIVFFVPEYTLFFDDRYLGMTTFPELVFINPSILFEMSPGQYEIFCRYFREANERFYNDIEILKTKEKNKWPGYRRSGFNAKGDEVSHWAYNDDHDLQSTPVKGELNQDAIDETLETLEKWRKKGCKVYFFSPCVYDEYYYASQDKIEKLDSALRAKCKYYHGNPSGAIYPRNKMFDTDYHLSDEGVKENTARLIENYRKQAAETQPKR